MLLRGEVQDPPQNIQSLPLSTKNEFMQIEEENVGQKNGISDEDTVGKVK